MVTIKFLQVPNALIISDQISMHHAKVGYALYPVCIYIHHTVLHYTVCILTDIWTYVYCMHSCIIIVNIIMCH